MLVSRLVFEREVDGIAFKSLDCLTQEILAAYVPAEMLHDSRPVFRDGHTAGAYYERVEWDVVDSRDCIAEALFERIGDKGYGKSVGELFQIYGSVAVLAFRLHLADAGVSVAERQKKLCNPSGKLIAVGYRVSPYAFGEVACRGIKIRTSPVGCIGVGMRFFKISDEFAEVGMYGVYGKCSPLGSAGGEYCQRYQEGCKWFFS